MNYMKFFKKFWEKIRPKTYFDLLVLNQKIYLGGIMTIREQLEVEMDKQEIEEMEENDENKNILFK